MIDREARKKMAELALGLASGLIASDLAGKTKKLAVKLAFSFLNIN